MSGASAGACTAALVVAVAAWVRALTRRHRADRVVRRLSRDVTSSRAARPAITAPPRVRALLADAGIDAPPDLVASRAVAGLAAVALIGGLAGGPVGGVVLPLLGTATAAGGLVALRGRGGRRYAAALPLALDLVARSLRTGASLPQAVVEAAAATPGPLGDDLAAVGDRCGLGQPFAAAVEAWADARPHRGVRLAAAALCLGAETGGARARAVDGVAATLREHLAVDDEVRALTSQARTSALVLAIAPVAFCAVTVVADSAAADFLLRTPLGLALLGAGLALDALAAAWMHRLTTRVTA